MRILFVSAFALITTLTHASQPGDDLKVEGVLVRLALERAAFIACADSEITRGELASSWVPEMASAAEVMKQHGLPAEFIAKQQALDLEALKPVFANATARQKFCDSLGDLQRRWDLFYVPSVESEVRRVLEQ